MKREVDSRYQFNAVDVLESLFMLCDRRDIPRPQSHRVEDGSVDLTLSGSGALLHWVDVVDDQK